MTATHAREESQENRISNKDFQRLKENFQSNGLITMEQKLNPQMMMMMMMMKNSTTSTTAQSNFDRCFSDKLKKFTEIDQTSSEGSGSGSGSESSTEEEEEEYYSPKSVKEFGLKRFVHHQVLKIREEDSHIGEDYIKEITLIHHLTSQQVRALILPSSPLSGKSSIKSFH